MFSLRPVPMNEAERNEAERQEAARKAVAPKDTIRLNLDGYTEGSWKA